MGQIGPSLYCLFHSRGRRGRPVSEGLQLGIVLVPLGGGFRLHVTVPAGVGVGDAVATLEDLLTRRIRHAATQAAVL